VVDKVALGEVSLPVLLFSPVNIITPMPPYVYFCHITYVIVILNSVAKQKNTHTLSLSLCSLLWFDY